jgi:hypothetical protein
MTGAMERCTAMYPSANDHSFVLFANPGSRRVSLFQEALRHLGEPAATVLPYSELMDGDISVADQIRPDAIVKVDSPGKDFAVEKRILKLGAAEARDSGFVSASVDTIEAVPFRKGEILFPHQWYCGFSRLMARLRQDLRIAPPHRLMNDLPSIMTMFDKPRCHAALQGHGIPVPRGLCSPETPIRSHAQLLDRMAAAHMPRVFVKLAYGSSGSGVVALQTQGTRQQATTTVEMVRDSGQLRLFNSRRIRIYSDPADIRLLLDTLCSHHVHVEEWVPKAGISGRTFDLRIVGIAGRPRFIVARMSRTPITNLHLLNGRGNAAEVRGRLGAARWESLLETCRRVMAMFPDCLYVALDVLIRADWRAHYVLELNAFGDLLPGVLDEGEDSYAAQIAACRRAGVAA